MMAVTIIAGSCATGKKAYVVKEDEELFGTWINNDSNSTQTFEKLIFARPD